MSTQPTRESELVLLMKMNEGVEILERLIADIVESPSMPPHVGRLLARSAVTIRSLFTQNVQQTERIHSLEDELAALKQRLKEAPKAEPA